MVTTRMSSQGIWRVLVVIKVLYSLFVTTVAASIDHQDIRDGTSTVIEAADVHRVNGLRIDTFQTHFLIEEPYACDTNPFTVIFVHSAPENVNQRTNIRSTWGSISEHPEFNTKVLFIVGLPSVQSNASHIYDINKESAINRDILKISVVDAYGNLTVKSVAMLDWVNNNCKHVHYVIKTDDDTFLNTPLLINDLRGVVHTEFMMGDIIAGARPIRDRKSKYFTSTTEFNGSMYPTYLSGAVYVISGDLIPALVKAAKSTELFWLEDVYMTGLLARRVRAKHIYNAKFGIRIQSLSPCQLKRTIALHRIDSKEMINAWTLLEKENMKC